MPIACWSGWQRTICRNRIAYQSLAYARQLEDACCTCYAVFEAPTRRRRLVLPAGDSQRLTHYLFRFPAKFHPPVVRALLELYTKPGDRVLDPFCGSGTLLVEAAVAGRHAIGTDVDPLAVFVANAKAHPIRAKPLERLLEDLLARLKRYRGRDYDALQWVDLNLRQYERERRRLAVPAIPNLEHWFRRYVIVDLARLRREILRTEAPETQRRFYSCASQPLSATRQTQTPSPSRGSK
jgi:hypothetical protein